MNRLWLTPLQLAVIEQFLATETGQRFFLTGGTALADHLLERLRPPDAADSER